MKRLIVILAVVVCGLGGIALLRGQGEQIGKPPQQNEDRKPMPLPGVGGGKLTSQGELTIDGSAEVKAANDCATLFLGVNTRDPKASAAVNKNGDAMRRVMKVLRDAGVGEKDVRTVQFYLSQTWEHHKDGSSKMTGFAVSNTLSVEVKNLEKLGSVLDAAIEAGLTDVSRLQFKPQDVAKQTMEARGRAVQDARRKADALAAAAGYKVTGIKSLAEHSGIRPMPMYAGAMAARDAGGANVTPGWSTTRLQVAVTFTIAPKAAEADDRLGR